jgi:hypothetical protein
MTILSFPGRRLLLAGGLLLLIALPGCGGNSRVPLQGQVSYNGQPIDNGTITFAPEGGSTADTRPKAGTRIAGGKYAFQPSFGPLPGHYKVLITWDWKTGRKISTGDADSRDETKQILPPKYNGQTTLTADVKGGKTREDFNLEK